MTYSLFELAKERADEMIVDAREGGDVPVSWWWESVMYLTHDTRLLLARTTARQTKGEEGEETDPYKTSKETTSWQMQ